MLVCLCIRLGIHWLKCLGLGDRAPEVFYLNVKLLGFFFGPFKLLMVSFLGKSKILHISSSLSFIIMSPNPSG
jgi:hypothetical protein